MTEAERQCPNCGRIYGAEAWSLEKCPACNSSFKEETEILSDTLSMQLPWPQGEREVEVGTAGGYLDAQLLKAALESEGIPVLLKGETSSQALGVWVGSLGEVQIFVPQSREQEAKNILEMTDNH